MSTRILLADDHRLVRGGLRKLIDKQTGMEVVAEAGDGRTAVRSAKELSPDVVLMDISMPDLNGIEATRRIVAETPGVKVIAVSMHSDKRFVTSMLAAGACGYLLKNRASEELARAIRTVLANETYLSPGIADIVAEEDAAGLAAEGPSAYSVLTPREREVLRLLAEGMSTDETASRLSVCAKTIEKHRRHIAEKLGTDDDAELRRYAELEGLLPPGS